MKVWARLTALVVLSAGAIVSMPAHAGAAPLQATLEADGFVVQPGETKVANAVELVDDGTLASAAGANVGQRYKRFELPGPPGPGGEAGEAPSGVFKLRPEEAIVYAGPTPPRADYFSFTPFLFVRAENPIVPKGDWLFASVGDPLNDAVIGTEGRQGPFAARTLVIFTADRGTFDRVARAARRAGYSAKAINRYVIPSSLLRLGTAEDSDSFVILIRTANLASRQAARRYLADDHYATVLRVTPSTPQTLSPSPQPRWRRREAIPETRLVPGIRRALGRLKKAIVARTPATASRSFSSTRWFADSRDVLPDNPSSPAYRQFVAGESSDTPYLRTAHAGRAANFTLNAGDEVVVYGVNHVATGIATYSSLGVYGEWLLSSCDQAGMNTYLIGCGLPSWNGVAGMTNHEFKGSARHYLPRDRMARFLYAVTVRRGPCPEKDRFCLSVPEPSRPGSVDGIPLDAPTMIGYRAYVNPRTNAGPAYTDIVADRAFWFRPR